MGLLSGLGKVDWGSVANGLGAAQSFFDGDFATGSGLLAYGAKQRSAAQKARDEEEQLKRLRQGLINQGLSPDQADLVLNNAANIGDFKEEPEKPIAAQRNAEWWMSATPEQKTALEEYSRTTQPRFTTGPDGRQYEVPRMNTPSPGQIEDGYRFKGGNPSDPNNWEEVGGGVGNGVGTFRGPYGF